MSSLSESWFFAKNTTQKYLQEKKSKTHSAIEETTTDGSEQRTSKTSDGVAIGVEEIRRVSDRLRVLVRYSLKCVVAPRYLRVVSCYLCRFMSKELWLLMDSVVWWIFGMIVGCEFVGVCSVGIRNEKFHTKRVCAKVHFDQNALFYIRQNRHRTMEIAQ